MKPPLDCIVIGYYEPPFEEYATMVGQYGARSPAYRDLRFSFINEGARRLNYVDLLNRAWQMRPGPEQDRLMDRPFLSGDIPNLAAVYLSTFLRRQGFRADYINLFAYEKAALKEHLACGPLCVAITTTFYVLNDPVIEQVSFIREHNPDVKIVVGGPLIANHFRQHYSNLALSSSAESRAEMLQYALEDMGADIYVNEAQGEATLASILTCLQQRSTLALVPNIAYTDGDRLRITETKSEANVMDANTIDWSELQVDRLGPTIQTRTARSCAFSCSFCNYPTRAGRLSLASVEAVTKELDSIASLGQVRNVVFIDDTFNVPLERFKQLCRLLIDRGYGFNWFSYFRCSNADREAIELMAKSGCRGVFLGIESGSPAILKNMHKAATIEKYAEGIGMLRDVGILTFASFITGFPGETRETIEETITFVRQHRPDYYRTQLWYCEPGTPIEQQREKFDLEGLGFAWQHRTMGSAQAMDHIERMFLDVSESTWLPQWSFDFWIIPYLLGRGMTAGGFNQFMAEANRLLALEIAGVSGAEKALKQHEGFARLGALAADWQIS